MDSVRTSLRNIAIIAHVDHGKTTLVDAMLRQTGTFRAHQELVDRVMDSGDLEKEKGITILAKVASVTVGDVKINIVDTPGHADFGGEVERALHVVDGALLLVDASEGPLPQTRYVLHKALERRLPIVLCLNKVDRPDARPKEVLDEVYELFMDLDADESQIEFPVLYAISREGRAGTTPDDLQDGLGPLFDALLRVTPAPMYTEGHPLQVLVNNLGADPYVGRLAIGRIRNGTIKAGSNVVVLREGEPVGPPARVTKLMDARGLGWELCEEADAGDIVAVAGLGDILVGDTIADPADPRPLPPLRIDQPSLTMQFGVNTSPLAGREGKFLTARHVRGRLEREALGNVSIQLFDTPSADALEVQGRGELQLAVLIEQMRREGYELQVSKPEVITKEVDGQLHEPYETVTIDVPEDFVGVVTEQLNIRKGRMKTLTNHQTGWARLEFKVPARGLLGFRSQLLTDTKGTAILHHVFAGYESWAGQIRHRMTGVLVADRSGATTSYALDQLQDRGEMFVGPGVEVYEGMIVGENSRADDLDVNICKEKQKTNIRAASSDEGIKLVPPLVMSLEQALEFVAGDELVELTPKSIRLRKRILDPNERRRQSRKDKQ
ncbi:MAG TPA: translational GTPase TypA [Actinomycetota bacterium]|nr:translational GTPase TypA [Actinomycetota bacterium]